MGYSVYIFRKEVKEKNSTLDFLDNTDVIDKFSKEQFEYLEKSLLKYGYEFIKKEVSCLEFEHKRLKLTALLNPTVLSFSSGFTEEGIFEISQTASELVMDNDDLVKFDPQDNTWEE